MLWGDGWKCNTHEDTVYIYSISVYAQKLGYAQTAGIFVYPVIAENYFSSVYELQILRT
jgi:hypothetical protein